MLKQFLNVQYLEQPGEINITGMERLSEVKTAIKKFYRSLSQKDTASIQLKDQQGNIVKDLEEVGTKYLSKMGPAFDIHLLRPPALDLEPFPDFPSAWLEGLPGSSKPSIRRTALVSDIAQKVEALGSLIITSPIYWKNIIGQIDVQSLAKCWHLVSSG